LELAGSREFSLNIDLNEYGRSGNINELKAGGIWDKIQVGSSSDGTNLTGMVDFKKVRKLMFKSVSY
jgi:hypothetical protein